MFFDNNIFIAMDKGEKINIIPKMLNRHGLIAGATGTGKTVTLKVLAESLSDAGIPVVLADVKGDLSGMCKPGELSERLSERMSAIGIDKTNFPFKSYPSMFWDIMGKKGLPIRTTISEFGYLLLARLLDLNQTQTEILNIIFKIADDEELLLIDIKDLKSMLNYVSDNASLYKDSYGNIAKQSIGAIMRAVVSLEDRGGNIFFGEPALDIHDWFRAEDSKGVINILDASSLITDSLLYSTFMLWLLAEMFETLPEVGDLEKPKLVFFFDEAHLLFKDAPKILMQKIEQVVKLIRSKGIGIFFITQSPSDIPDEVLAQLGNKIQHALRAYTPNEQKALRAAANSYRAEEGFNVAEAITNLGIGDAVVSFIGADGAPSIVKKVSIIVPQSYMGTIDDFTKDNIYKSSYLAKRYLDSFDRDSAYELLDRKRKEIEQEATREIESKNTAQKDEQTKQIVAKSMGSVGKTAAGTIGRELGNTIGNSIGGKFGKRLGGNIGASLGRGILQTLFRL